MEKTDTVDALVERLRETNYGAGLVDASLAFSIIDRLRARVGEVEGELETARTMKPNEYEHLRASERAAHEAKRNAEAKLAAAEREREWYNAAHLLIAAGCAFVGTPEGEIFIHIEASAKKDGTPILALNMNDVFYWGCADCESFEYADAPKLWAIYKEHGHNGLVKWARDNRKAKGEGWDEGHLLKYTPELPLLDRLEKAEARADAAERDAARARSGAVWLVWSNEHSAWWGPNASGYYTDIEAAGRYDLNGALRCCASRSRGSVPPEIMVPSPELIKALADPPAPAKEDDNG